LPTDTPTATATATQGPSPTPTNTPTDTPTPTNTPMPTATPTPSNLPLYVSLLNSGPTTVGNLTGIRDEDIIRFDGQTWYMFFDGSDVGVGGVDVTAFEIVDSDTILISFDKTITINPIGAVEKQDIVQFDATSTGDVTAGTFSLYLDGSDIGLDTNGENVDALGILSDGRLIISTGSTFSVIGATGADEDLLALTIISTGIDSQGTWELYFDGSDVGLSNSAGEDVDAFTIGANGDFYLSTLDIFAVTGVSGFDEDVFICTPLTLGLTTTCTFQTALYFDGSTWNLSADDIDAIDLP